MEPYKAILSLADDIEEGYQELRLDPNYIGNVAHGSWVLVHEDGTYLACALSCVGHKQSGFTCKDTDLREYMQIKGIDNHPSKGVIIDRKILESCLESDEWERYPKSDDMNWWDINNLLVHTAVIKMNDICEMNPIRIAKVLRDIAKKVKNS